MLEAGATVYLLSFPWPYPSLQLFPLKDLKGCVSVSVPLARQRDSNFGGILDTLQLFRYKFRLIQLNRKCGLFYYNSVSFPHLDSSNHVSRIEIQTWRFGRGKYDNGTMITSLLNLPGWVAWRSSAGKTFCSTIFLGFGQSASQSQSHLRFLLEYTNKFIMDTSIS